MTDLSVVSPASPSPLARLVDDYLMACRARGLARSTTSGSYGYPLRSVFLPWCDRQGITELSVLTSRTMDTFSVHLLEDGGKGGRPLAKASIHAYVRGVRGFLQWCEQEGEGKLPRPALPTLPRRVLDVLDRDEIDRLEGAAQSERDRLIIRILGDCGLRAAELCSLRPESVLRRDRQAHLLVSGKGERDRLVPLPPALLRRLERYIKDSRPTDTRSTQLFLGLRRGRSGDYEPLTPSGVLQLLTRTTDRAGITKRVYTHLLRHSFITNALRAGMSPILVAKVAGHSSLRMIERVYSHLTTDDAYNAMVEMLAHRGGR
jgi:integrase